MIGTKPFEQSFACEGEGTKDASLFLCIKSSKSSLDELGFISCLSSPNSELNVVPSPLMLLLLLLILLLILSFAWLLIASLLFNILLELLLLIGAVGAVLLALLFELEFLLILVLVLNKFEEIMREFLWLKFLLLLLTLILALLFSGGDEEFVRCIWCGWGACWLKNLLVLSPFLLLLLLLLLQRLILVLELFKIRGVLALGSF